MHEVQRWAAAGWGQQEEKMFIGRGNISSSVCPSSSSSSASPPFSNAGPAQAVYIDKTAIFSVDELHTLK